MDLGTTSGEELQWGNLIALRSATSLCLKLLARLIAHDDELKVVSQLAAMHAVVLTQVQDFRIKDADSARAERIRAAAESAADDLFAVLRRASQ